MSLFVIEFYGNYRETVARERFVQVGVIRYYRRPMAEILYGKPVAAEIEKRVVGDLAELRKTHGLIPRLDVVLVGKSAPSQRYVKKKLDACERLGMVARLHNLEEDVRGEEVLNLVAELDGDKNVHGILVQLPLPQHIEEPKQTPAKRLVDKYAIFDAVRAEKDVDGISRHSVAELYRGQQDHLIMLPATALAVRRILAFYKISTHGKTAVVIGRSDITAKPIHHMLGGRMCNATAIWCHKHTPTEVHDELMRNADLIVTSVGNESYKITADMIKPGAVVIDVATRVGPDGKLVGDVDFESVGRVASGITPVPGGVGPVTVAALMENLVRAAQFSAGISPRGYLF